MMLYRFASASPESPDFSEHPYAYKDDTGTLRTLMFCLICFIIMLGSLLGQTSTFPCDECVENPIKVEYL